MRELKFDYLQSEHDGKVLKEFLVEQVSRFENHEQMINYIKSGIDGFWQEVRNEIAKQYKVRRFSDIENFRWICDYLDYLADKDLAKVMNEGLNTKNRKYADFEKFYEKYSKVS